MMLAGDLLRELFQLATHLKSRLAGLIVGLKRPAIGADRSPLMTAEELVNVQQSLRWVEKHVELRALFKREPLGPAWILSSRQVVFTSYRSASAAVHTAPAAKVGFSGAAWGKRRATIPRQHAGRIPCRAASPSGQPRHRPGFWESSAYPKAARPNRTAQPGCRSRTTG